MNFLEKDLEQIIFETNNDVLNEKGLPIYGKKLRQVRIGNYGIADLITLTRPSYIESIDSYDCGFLISIYELKLKEIDINTIMQSARYLRGIKNYLKYRGHNVQDFRFNINLVGREIKMCYITDLLMSLEYFESNITFNFYTYSMNINGLSFQEENIHLCLRDDGFEKTKKPIIKNDIQKPKLKTVSEWIKF